jgi:hypothetical protein
MWYSLSVEDLAAMPGLSVIKTVNTFGICLKNNLWLVQSS